MAASPNGPSSCVRSLWIRPSSDRWSPKSECPKRRPSVRRQGEGQVTAGLASRTNHAETGTNISPSPASRFGKSEMPKAKRGMEDQLGDDQLGDDQLVYNTHQKQTFMIGFSHSSLLIYIYIERERTFMIVLSTHHSLYMYREGGRDTCHGHTARARCFCTPTVSSCGSSGGSFPPRGKASTGRG